MITVKIGDYEYAVKIAPDDSLIYTLIKSMGEFVGVGRYKWSQVLPAHAEAMTGLHYPPAFDYLRECVHDGVSITRNLQPR